MATCDLCDRPVEAGAPAYPAAKVREAARAGLRPEADGSFDMDAWVQYVEQDTTEWTLCASCAARVGALTGEAAPLTEAAVLPEPEAEAAPASETAVTLETAPPTEAPAGGAISAPPAAPRSKTPLYAILGIAVLAALGIIFALWRFGRGSDAYTAVSAAELTTVAESLPPQQRQMLADNEASRKELIKNVQRMYSLAQAAQGGGVERGDKFRGQWAIQADQALATEYNKRNPGAEVPKAEIDAYVSAHQKEFDADLKMIGQEGQAPPPEQIDLLKSQWGDLKVRAEKARQAGLDKDPALAMQLKFRRANLLANLYARSIEEQLKPGQQEIEAYLKEHPEADKEKLKKRADELLARVKSGEDFAKIADEVNGDGTRGQGGDLGFFGKGKMDPVFEEAAFKLEPGQVSDVVSTQFGYHIIKVDERRQAAPKKEGASAEQGPQPEVKARHIYLSTQEAETVSNQISEQKVKRAIEDASLKYPVSAPADFPINIPGRQPNQKLPGLGSGQRGLMAPITPEPKK
jgi:peptidyl-prolyl cis-trans isomerase C